MTINPKKNLRVEIFLCLLFGSLVPALFILVLSARQLYENQTSELVNKVEEGLEVVRADLGSLMSNFKSSTTILSKEKPLMELIEAGEEAHENLALFAAHRKRTMALENVAIYNKNGSMLVSTDKKAISKLDDDLLDRIERKKEEKIPVLTRFSVDQERGFRMDAYAPVIGPFYKNLQGILQETIFIDKKFIEAVKQKTGLEVGFFHQEKAFLFTLSDVPVLDSSIYRDFSKRKNLTIQSTLIIDEMPYSAILEPVLNEDGTLFRCHRTICFP